MNGLLTRTYIINFATGAANVVGLQNFIQFDPRVLAYWNYIPFVYCIKSTSSAQELTLAIEPYFPDGNFLVGEINTGNVNGKLPKAAWDWFYAPVFPRNPLAGGLPSPPGFPAPPPFGSTKKSA